MVGAAALGLGASALPTTSRLAHSAQPPGDFAGCKIVVFGSDSLRIDYAQSLVAQGAPALGSLNDPTCSLNGGVSATQPGWATIWTGLPSMFHKAFSNNDYDAMPTGMHIMAKLMRVYRQQDFFAVWITGKGKNIKGDIVRSPHNQVYRFIVSGTYPGIYHGDSERSDAEVFELAQQALSEAITHQNFCCFIHFANPDRTGHAQRDYDAYM